MKVLIIEDEQLAIDRLIRLLKEIEPQTEILATIATISEAVKWLYANVCDLIFLDIHLADGLSFNIFDQINIEIPIVFTTAYDQYAIKAFQLNSVDYLLKPFSKTDLEKSLYKYKTFFNPSKSANVDFKSLLETISQQYESYQKRFMVSSGQKIKTVACEDIAYFYAEEKMVFLCTFENRNYIIDYTIDKVEQVVSPEMFFRINRRFIINIKAIHEMHSYPKSRVKIDLLPPCKHESIVSIERSARFRQWLNK